MTQISLNKKVGRASERRNIPINSPGWRLERDIKYMASASKIYNPYFKFAYIQNTS